MKWTHARITGLTLTILSGCAPVPYEVDWSELVLLPPDTAVRYLQSLPEAAPALSARRDLQHCEFDTRGLRVAAANPQNAEQTANRLRGELRRVAAEKQAAERERVRIEAAQRDRLRWMSANGFADLAAEQARLEAEHRDPARWLQVRGLPPDRTDQAIAGMRRERGDLDSRMRPVDAAMARERQVAADRLETTLHRERQIQTSLDEALGRVHEIVPYDRVAFVVYRRLRGTMEIDVRYALGETPAIDGCGYQLDPSHPQTADTIRRIATALSALGAEGQAGVAAEPPIGAGRRYSAQPDDLPQVTGAPEPEGDPPARAVTN